MRAFITGATGFLGRRVVAKLLEDGHEVVVLARPSRDTTELEAKGVTVVRGDLSDVDAFGSELKGCDVVYHIGARVVTHGEWETFVAENVTATEKLLAAAMDAGVKRFVHVSSLGIFEIGEDGMTVDEETDYDYNPVMRGFYTRSKIHADRVARAAARSGKPVVVVRPGQIYGADHPQEPVFLGRVNKFIGSNILAVVSTPDYPPPITYVENAAEGVVLAGTVPGIEGGVYNLVDDPDLTQAEYFRTLSSVRSKPLRVFYLPVSLFAIPVKAVDLLFRIAKRRPWSVAHQLLRSGNRAKYTTMAAQAGLGWQPRKSLAVCLEESLAGKA